MISPEGFAPIASFDDFFEPARITTAASSTASGSSFDRNAGTPPIYVSLPVSSSASATSRSWSPSDDCPNTSTISRPSSVSPPTRAISAGLESANLSLRFRSRERSGLPAEIAAYETARAKRDSTRHIRAREDEQHRLRPVPDRVNRRTHQHKQNGRSRTQHVELFETPVTPRAHHQKGKQCQQGEPQRGPVKARDGIAVECINNGRHHPCRGWNRQPHEILAGGQPRISGHGVFLDIESRQPHRPADQKQERQKFSRALQLIEHPGSERCPHECHAPYISQDRGRDSEADDVGQRIELAAELAGCVGHARDAPVKPVQQNCEPDRLRRYFEIERRLAWIRPERQRPLKSPQNRKIPQEDVPGREQRGQRIGCARRTLLRRLIGIYV